MAVWHLKELDEQLRAAGWRVVAQHSGDGRRISASWEVQRSTRYPAVVIDFQGMDEQERLPLERAYACALRDLPSNALYFGSRNQQWSEGVRAFVQSLDYSENAFTLDYDLQKDGSSAYVRFYPGPNNPL